MAKLTEKEIEKRVLAAMGENNPAQPQAPQVNPLQALLERANQVRQRGAGLQNMGMLR